MAGTVSLSDAGSERSTPRRTKSYNDMQNARVVAADDDDDDQATEMNNSFTGELSCLVRRLAPERRHLPARRRTAPRIISNPLSSVHFSYSGPSRASIWSHL